MGGLSEGRSMGFRAVTFQPDPFRLNNPGIMRGTPPRISSFPDPWNYGQIPA